MVHINEYTVFHAQDRLFKILCKALGVIAAFLGSTNLSA
jgi:hypothetical protein